MQRNDQPQLRIENVKDEREEWPEKQESGQIYREVVGGEKEELKVGVSRGGDVNGIEERDESGLPSYRQATKS